MSDKDYCEKLQKVLSQLLIQRSVSLDDTCLQKLIDRLRVLLNNEVVDVNIFHDFLFNIKFDDDCFDESVKTFAVHVFGVLGEKEEVFRCLLEEERVGKSFEKLQGCVCSEDLSILTATFISLTHIIGHKTGLQWFLQTSSDAINIAFQVLKGGRSVFVVSSAHSFLVELLRSFTNFQQQIQDDFVKICDKYRSQILEDVWSLIKSPADVHLSITKTSIQTDHLTGLQLVKAIYLENDIAGIKLDKEKIGVIINCLYRENKIVTSYALDILESSYRSGGEELADHLESCIESTTEQLLHQGKVFTALIIAQKLFYRFPKSKSKQLETLALSPLNAVFSLDSSEDVSTKIRSALKTKSDFTRVMASTIMTITHQEEKDPLLKMVQLLRCTVGERTPEVIYGRKHLHENRHIQRVILETIQQCVSEGNLHVFEDENVISETSRGLLSLTEDCNTPVQVLMVLFKTWTKILPIYYSKHEASNLVYKGDNQTAKGDNKCDRTKGDNSNIEGSDEPNMEEVLTKLAVCVEKKMCDLQWEVRDTAVEFIGDLLVGKDNLPLLAWIKSHRLDVSLWQCIRDQESYIRATTLRGISRLLQADPQSLQAVASMEELVKKCCEIVETDSEAFPRRAAVDLLSVLYRLSEFPVDSELHVWTTMCQAATKDFDWDVQLKAMDFWQRFIDAKLTHIKDDTSVPEYAEIPTNSCVNGPQTKRKHNGSICLLSELEKLEKSGVFGVLFSCLKDSDQSVQEKACKMLMKLQEKLSTNCKELNWEHGSKKIKTNQNQSSVEDSISESKTFSIKSFILELEKMDLEKQLGEISLGCDEYVRNPQSLLEDILTSFSEKDNDTVMDCY